MFWNDQFRYHGNSDLPCEYFRWFLSFFLLLLGARIPSMGPSHKLFPKSGLTEVIRLQQTPQPAEDENGVVRTAYDDFEFPKPYWNSDRSYGRVSPRDVFSRRFVMMLLCIPLGLNASCNVKKKKSLGKKNSILKTAHKTTSHKQPFFLSKAKYKCGSDSGFSKCIWVFVLRASLRGPVVKSHQWPFDPCTDKPASQRCCKMKQLLYCWP